LQESYKFILTVNSSFQEFERFVTFMMICVHDVEFNIT